MQTTSSVLPSAPTDQERDLYAGRSYVPMALATAAASLFVLVSSIRFTLLSSALVVLLPYFLFMGLYGLIALYINASSRRFDLAGHHERVRDWDPARLPSVDVFLPVAGEPLEVLRNTWRHVHDLQYDGPLVVYVLDDADSEDVRRMAGEFGFCYLVRPDRPHFKKAGNLRHGFVQSNGEFIAIFDADFTPRPDYLANILPYFEDSVGIVQTPQYFRVDERQSWLERGAGAVQEFFYRVVQPARQRFNGSICVGTCAIYRRAALDDNGGTTLIEHSEDVHTGFDVRGHGWDLRYLPMNLATGACPDTLSAFFRQQYRWCMGSMSLLTSTKFWSRRLPLLTRGCYASGFFYYIATAINSITQPLVPLILLIALPQHVQLFNYLYVLPTLTLTLIVLPLWHRTRYRWVEVLATKMIYGWAHLFALVDMVRGRPMAWSPTGAATKGCARVQRFRCSIMLWGGGSAAVWVTASLWRMMTMGPQFLPMILLGALYLATVIRVATEILPPPRVLARPALALGLVVAVVSLSIVAPAHASPPRQLGVTTKADKVAQWETALDTHVRLVGQFAAWGTGVHLDEYAQAAWAIGAVPFLTWEPWQPASAKSIQPKYSNASIARGKHDAFLRESADSLRGVRTVYIRYAHEMNANWYPWHQGGPENYKKAWRHVRAVFRKEGATNVKFIWAPNKNWTTKGWKTQILRYYPGDRYVDAVGITMIERYGDMASYTRFIDILHATLSSKPVFLPEVNGTTSGWLTSFVKTVKARPWIKTIMWYEKLRYGSLLERPDQARLFGSLGR